MKTKYTFIQFMLLVSLSLLNTNLFAQNCAIPSPDAGCTAPTVFTFISAADGDWHVGSTWAGGVAPSIENINNQQIKITHDVTVQNGNIKLDNNTVILITDGGRLTLRNGNLYLEDGNQSSTEKLLIDNGFLRTSGNVQQNGSATVFCAIGASIEIGDEDARSTPLVFTAGLFNLSSSSTGADFQNTNGYRRLENVCLNVTEDMQNDGGRDELIGVCAEIGDQGAFSGPKNNSGGNSSFDGDDAGNFQFQSSTGTSTKIYNSEFYIPSGNVQNSKLMIICNADFRLTNGSFQNQSNSSITGDQIVIWINNSGNGTIQNSGSWQASTISAWRIDNSNNPSGLPGLVAESSATDILTNFNDCTCGGDDCPTTSDACTYTDCCVNMEFFGSPGGSAPEFTRLLFELAYLNGNGCDLNDIDEITFTFPQAAAIPINITEFTPTPPSNYTFSVSGNTVTYIPLGAFTQDFFAFDVPNAFITSAAGQEILVTMSSGSASISHTFILEVTTDINGDPEAECGVIVTLPVELISFTGASSSEGVDLNWVTASEKNNDRFEIERSADGKNFERIGDMKGKGSSSATSNYNLLDKRPLKGLNYYRLKQVDFDGSHAFSHIIKVNSEKGALSLGVQLIPNPCSDENCSVILQGVDATKTLVIEMKDLTGRLVFSHKVAADQNSFNLPKANLGKGIYILSAKNGEYITYQKVIIQ